MSKRAGYIALAGRPNAGKSTFLNHVLKQKISIVSDKPQTTRNRILGVYHSDDAQIGFFDLPGIHKPQHKMNRLMMRSVNQGLSDADLVFHFIDVSQAIGSGDRFVHETLTKTELPIILVANKIDLVNKAKMIPVLDQLYREFQPLELAPVSSVSGENLDRVLELAIPHLPEGEMLFDEDALTDQPLRFMVQEFIREKILHYTRDEIPHAVAVVIESWTEDESGYAISAVVNVERDTQRRILIGSGGRMISKIRTGARRSLKELLDKPVDLDLFVRVNEKWRDRDDLTEALRLSE